MTTKPLNISRRDVILAAVVGSGVVVAAIVVPTRASAKVSQRSVAYQGAPKAKARCANCIQWQPPAACKVVTGVISPNGWCSIYALKA